MNFVEFTVDSRVVSVNVDSIVRAEDFSSQRKATVITLLNNDKLYISMPYKEVIQRIEAASVTIEVERGCFFCNNKYPSEINFDFYDYCPKCGRRLKNDL